MIYYQRNLTILSLRQIIRVLIKRAQISSNQKNIRKRIPVNENNQHASQ